MGCGDICKEKDCERRKAKRTKNGDISLGLVPMEPPATIRSMPLTMEPPKPSKRKQQALGKTPPATGPERLIATNAHEDYRMNSKQPRKSSSRIQNNEWYRYSLVDLGTCEMRDLYLCGRCYHPTFHGKPHTWLRQLEPHCHTGEFTFLIRNGIYTLEEAQRVLRIGADLIKDTDIKLEQIEGVVQEQSERDRRKADRQRRKRKRKNKANPNLPESLMPV